MTARRRSAQGRATLRLLASRGVAAAATIAFVALAATDFAIQPGLLDVVQIGGEVQTALPLLLIGAAQTFVILTGGIDLSVGGVMVVSNALAATWASSHSTHWPYLVVILVIAAAMGMTNGVLVSYARIEPFVATLATWTIYDGIALWLLPTDGGTPPNSLINLVVGSTASIPNSLLVLAGLVLAWSYVRRTRFGRAIYATGSDPVRARQSGINVSLVRACAYGIAGVLSGIAGLALAGIAASGTPTAGNPYILNSVIAVVLGGTSLAGGIGGASRTLVGVGILTTIGDIVAVEQLSTWVSIAVTAILLIVVVSVPSIIERRRAMRGFA